MAHLASPAPKPAVRRRRILSASGPSRSSALTFLAVLWLVVFFASLFAPPLLDDADASHASAARHIVTSGDWVTLRIDGIRYLEKAPLPYWLVAISYRIFGFNTFATHLPQSLAVLLLALLGYHWAAHAFERRTAFYTGLGVLTAAGVFLFTRVFIPEVLLSFLLSATLYLFLRTLELTSQPAPQPLNHPSSRPKPGSPASAFARWGGKPGSPASVLARWGGKPGSPASALARWGGKRSEMEGPASLSHGTVDIAWRPYLMWTALALAVLTKGLVALVFFFGATLAYLVLTGSLRQLRALKPLTGALLFLAIAAPWHILAGLRNTGGLHGHGFFWFYFINEHVLRFLGRRYPRDYNKLPGYLYWSLHAVWLFPWSLFVPAGLLLAWRRLRNPEDPLLHRIRTLATARGRTTLLLTLYSLLILLFFSLSTNQEYYTFPAYLPLLMLIAAAISRAEATFASDPAARACITFAHVILTVVGAAAALALLVGLWQSRALPFVPDIGDLLAHRNVGNYTLSMSHFFDLTGPSFAALRLPAALAALAFAFGPALAWLCRQQRRHLAATVSIALVSAVFLLAAHLALTRFAPMLSSATFARHIQQLEQTHAIATLAPSGTTPTTHNPAGQVPSDHTEILLFGDQSYGSSIVFYLDRQIALVNGRSSSMLFGSTFPDAPPIFLTSADLLAHWGAGPRKVLFVPLEFRGQFDTLHLGPRAIPLQETSGKILYTDRPLNR